MGTDEHPSGPCSDGGGPGENAVWTIAAVQHVIEKSTLSHSLQEVERPPDPKHVRYTKPTPVASLPDEYLLFKLGRESGYANKSLIYSAAGGPFELRYVHSEQDDLVAVWYRAFNPRPSAMPLSTLWDGIADRSPQPPGRSPPASLPFLQAHCRPRGKAAPEIDDGLAFYCLRGPTR